MPVIKANKTLPTAAMPVPEITFNYNEATNQLEFSGTFSFDYPDEAIINRFGRLPKDEKGNPTGEPKPVTQKTYGRGVKLFTGSADGEDNPMFLTLRLFAETKDAEGEGEVGEGEGE